jgi:clan AA aspartic protease
VGIIKTDIIISNVNDAKLQPMQINALVDTGSLHLCIPANVATQLKLKVFEQRQVTLASGEIRLVDYVGPILLKWENRQCLVGALVLGDMPLLGAIPMEDMDLVIHPAQLKIIANPAHPNIAASIAMSFTTNNK